MGCGAQVRHVAAITITQALRSNACAARFLQLRRSVLRVQRAALRMLLTRWERKFCKYLTEDEIAVVNGIGELKRKTSADEKPLAHYLIEVRVASGGGSHHHKCLLTIRSPAGSAGGA